MVALGILVPSVSVRIAAVQLQKAPSKRGFFVELQGSGAARFLTLPHPKPLPSGEGLEKALRALFGGYAVGLSCWK